MSSRGSRGDRARRGSGLEASASGREAVRTETSSGAVPTSPEPTATDELPRAVWSPFGPGTDGPTARPRDLQLELGLDPYLHCDPARGAPAPDVDAPALLRQEVARLARLGRSGRVVALGTEADPYHPLERRARVTRGLLEVLATLDGARLVVTTRSDLVLRDVDVLREIGRRGHVRVNVTVTTVDRDLARLLEPGAPTPRKRLEGLAGLVSAGVPAGLLATPVLPGITDAPRDLRALVCEAQTAGARWFGARALALHPGVRIEFFEWLARNRPDLVTRYHRWYRSERPAPSVSERIERTLEALRHQYGIAGSVPMPDDAQPAPRQMSLFESLFEPTREARRPNASVRPPLVRRTGAA
jgi:DNA repair photolyase